jgi:hypothetical protein
VPDAALQRRHLVSDCAKPLTIRSFAPIFTGSCVA